MRQTLKELSKYLLILAAAGVVGYLGGHWRSDSPSLPPKDQTIALEARVKNLESRMKSLDGSVNGWHPNLQDRVKELEYQQKTERLNPFSVR